jgi:hypothetical protein
MAMTSLPTAQAWAGGAAGRELKVRDPMRTVDVQQRGKRGTIIASRNRFGQYLKDYVPVEQPITAAQLRVWGNTRHLWRLWNEISDARRAGWWKLAETVTSRPTLGQSGRLDGPILFRKLNTVLHTCQRDPLLDAPQLPSFGRNPAIGFDIREGKRGIAMKVKLSPDIRWSDRPKLEDLMVFAWAPRNPGASRHNLYAFIGLLPPPVKGESDITELYLKKLKEWRKLAPEQYHIPLEGSRIFIRVWQQMDGWENVLGVFRDNALVPPRRWPR